MPPRPLRIRRAISAPAIGPIRKILPAVILFYAMLMPDEVRFVINDQTIYAPRFVYFCLTYWVVANLINLRVTFRLADWLILSGAVWAPLSFVIYYGFDKGFTRGMILGLDIAMPYLIGRIAITSLDDFRRLLVMVAPAVLLAGLAIVAESLAGREIVRPIFADIFSPLPNWVNGVASGDRISFVDYRYGFLRVAGPFTHPIIAAAFMGTLLIAYAGAGLRNWPLWVGLATLLFNLLTFSSAGVFVVVMGALIIAYELLQRHSTFLTWKHGLAAVAVMLATISLASERGIIGLLGLLAFNPESVGYRQLIWEYGSQWALQHPLFGTGFDDWARPSWMRVPTVDNYWLAIAMRHGLYEVFALLGGLIAVLWLAVRALPFTASSIDRRTQFALLTAIAALGVVEWTFFLFGGLFSWHYMMLGCAYSISVGLMTSGNPANRPLNTRIMADGFVREK